jgi:hypothetical protein
MLPCSYTKRVLLHWPAGVVKQKLMFHDAQGQPLLLDTNNEYLAVLTSAAQVRVFRLAGREAKPHAGPGEGADSTTVNNNGVAAASLTLHSQQRFVRSCDHAAAFMRCMLFGASVCICRTRSARIMQAFMHAHAANSAAWLTMLTACAVSVAVLFLQAHSWLLAVPVTASSWIPFV